MSPEEVQKLKDIACQRIDNASADLVDVSHQIHSKPEQNFEEFFASQLLAKTSTQWGLTTDIDVHGCETAFRADIGTGPMVCIMSEYDALPDIGHGCGHNVIAAAGLGAAIGLAAVASQCGGALRYLGTPGEEGGGVA